jgi:hypothetical protein
MFTKIDIDGYCKKYNIKHKATILKAFKQQKPKLKNCIKKFDWGESKRSGYFFECFGINISIEGSVDDVDDSFHVTFIGFDGVNADYSEYTFED